MEFTARLEEILKIAPVEVNVQLNSDGKFDVACLQEIDGKPFRAVFKSSESELGKCDVDVVYEGLKAPISKENMVAEQFTKLCTTLEGFVTTKGVVTAKNKGFARTFGQFVALVLRGVNVTENSDLSIKTDMRTLEITLHDMGKGTIYLFALGDAENLFPIGASLPNGKHSILANEQKLTEIFING